MVYNPYIIIPLAVWAITQIIKFAIKAFNGEIDFRNLYVSGGMPSVHSAVVSSLAVTALLIDGWGNHLFGFAAVFAAIVMYDSLGVRRAVGEQGAALNAIITNLGRDRLKLPPEYTEVREVLGHRPAEVGAGALLGVVLAGLFNYDRLSGFIAFLTTAPHVREYRIYAVIFAVVVVAGIAQRLVLGKRSKRSPSLRRLTKRIFSTTQGLGWLGLLAVLFEFEQASVLAWRLWPIVIAAAVVITGIILAVHFGRRLPEALAAEAEAARKRKWLEFGKRRRKRA